MAASDPEQADAADTDLDDQPEQDVYQFVLATVEDTLGGNDKPLWSSRTQVLGEAVKSTNDFDKPAARAAISRAIANDDLFHWHGLLAPADPDHLRKIIQAEQQADITRKIMIGQINKLLKRLKEGGSDA